MSHTHSYYTTLRFQEDNETEIVTTTESSITAPRERNLEVAFIGSASDAEHDIGIPTAIFSLYMLSDQDLTVETNDGDSPDHTFTLTANEPFYWHSNMDVVSPLGGNQIDSVFLTNSGSEAGTFKLIALV